MNFIDFTIQALSEDTRFKNIDISEGSNIYDLVITIIEYLVSEKLDEEILDGIITALDISNYEDMTTAELRRLAANHLIELPVRNQTIGQVYLYTASPEEITISSGNKFYAGTVECEAIYDVDIGESDYTVVDSYYVAPPIDIKNESGANFAANTIGSMDNAPDSLVKIVHSAITSGIEEKTAEQIYSMIRNSISSRQFMNRAGIQNTILRLFSGVKRVEVIGQGEDDMLRDRLYNVTSPSDAIDIVADFSGKIRGFLDEEPYHVYNNNRAYKVFVDDIGDELEATDGTEFTQIDYIGIMEDNDDVTVSFSTDNILTETFSEGSEIGGTRIDLDGDVDEDDTEITLDNVTGLVEGLSIKIASYDGDGDKEATKINVIRSITTATNIITLYTSVGKDITAANGDGAYIEVVDSMGYFIGEGWVKGEDGLGLGKVLAKEAVMIVDSTLVIGTESSEYGGNIILETVVKNGIDNFMDALEEAITLKNVIRISGGGTEELIDNIRVKDGEISPVTPDERRRTPRDSETILR